MDDSSNSSPLPNPRPVFKPLPEVANDKDQLVGGCHKRVAEEISNVISSDEDGLTIGLVGAYGSGKSTIVRVVETQLRDRSAPRIIYYYFDSWAHQGDCLRRAFLKGLVTEILESYGQVTNGEPHPENATTRKYQATIDELKKLRDRLSNRSEVTTKSHSPAANWLTKLMVISLSLVPIGAAIISGTASQVCLVVGNPLHGMFCLGLLLTLTPLLILFGNLVALATGCRKIPSDETPAPDDSLDSATAQAHKKFATFSNLIKTASENKGHIFDGRAWQFLESETKTPPRTEFVEAEPSSLEFQEFFLEILATAFANTDDDIDRKAFDRLLIVVDNLDRIDQLSARKTWSTLQTFLQKRNPAGNGANSTVLLQKKVTVLVPYDETNLESIWPSNQQCSPTGERDSEQPLARQVPSLKSLFDKSFQVRFRTPELLRKDWEAFCRQCFEDAAAGSITKDELKPSIDRIIEILSMLIERPVDAPSPREIKVLVNQIGTTLKVSDKAISIDAVAYFAALKYLFNESDVKIKAQLLSSAIPHPGLKALFSSDLPKEMCGLYYGRTATEGAELLIGEEIARMSTRSGQSSEDYTLYQEHVEAMITTYGSAFWSSLQTLFIQGKRLDQSLNLCEFVNLYLITKHLNECGNFLRLLSGRVNGASFNQAKPDTSNFTAYKAMFSLLERAGGIDLSAVWQGLLQESRDILENSGSGKNSDLDIESLLRFFDDIAGVAGHPDGFNERISLTISAWCGIARASEARQFQAWRYLTPQENFSADMAAEMNKTNVISDSIVLAAAFARRSGYENWGPLLNHLSQNLANLYIVAAQNNEIPRVTELLSAILPWPDQTRQTCEGILKAIADTALVTRTPTDETKFNTLYAIAWPDGQLWRPDQNNQKSIRLIDWWNQPDDTCAKIVLEHARKLGHMDFVWKRLQKGPSFLASEVILAALKEEAYELFDQSKIPSQILALLGALVPGKEAPTVQGFLAMTKDKNKLFDEALVNLDQNASELLTLAVQLDSEDLDRILASRLLTLEESRWNRALDELHPVGKGKDSPLLNLATMLITKKRMNDLPPALIESVRNRVVFWLSQPQHDPRSDQIKAVTSLIGRMEQTSKAGVISSIRNRVLDSGISGCSELNQYLVTVLFPEDILDSATNFLRRLADRPELIAEAASAKQIQAFRNILPSHQLKGHTVLFDENFSKVCTTIRTWADQNQSAPNSKILKDILQILESFPSRPSTSDDVDSGKV